MGSSFSVHDLINRSAPDSTGPFATKRDTDDAALRKSAKDPSQARSPFSSTEKLQVTGDRLLARGFMTSLVDQFLAKAAATMAKIPGEAEKSAFADRVDAAASKINVSDIAPDFGLADPFAGTFDFSGVFVDAGFAMGSSGGSSAFSVSLPALPDALKRGGRFNTAAVFSPRG
jgi:hypothetical protein